LREFRRADRGVVVRGLDDGASSIRSRMPRHAGSVRALLVRHDEKEKVELYPLAQAR